MLRSEVQPGLRAGIVLCYSAQQQQRQIFVGFSWQAVPEYFDIPDFVHLGVDEQKLICCRTLCKVAASAQKAYTIRCVIVSNDVATNLVSTPTLKKRGQCECINARISARHQHFRSLHNCF